MKTRSQKSPAKFDASLLDLARCCILVEICRIREQISREVPGYRRRITPNRATEGASWGPYYSPSTLKKSIYGVVEVLLKHRLQVKVTVAAFIVSLITVCFFPISKASTRQELHFLHCIIHQERNGGLGLQELHLLHQAEI